MGSRSVDPADGEGRPPQRIIVCAASGAGQLVAGTRRAPRGARPWSGTLSAGCLAMACSTATASRTACVGPVGEDVRDGIGRVARRGGDGAVGGIGHVPREQLVEERRRGSSRRCARSRARRGPARARCSRRSRAPCPTGRARRRRAARSSARAIPKSVTLAPASREEHVLRLDVAVDDAVRVREGERSGDVDRRGRARGAAAAARSRATSCFRSSPSTCSKTMYWLPSASPRSMTVTMFGWLSRATARASRRKRST